MFVMSSLGSKPRSRPADDRGWEESPRLQLSSDVPACAELSTDRYLLCGLGNGVYYGESHPVNPVQDLASRVMHWMQWRVFGPLYVHQM